MVVQAQGGQAAAPDPGAMTTALSRIEAIGQQTLTELRGLLHRVGWPADAVREPQPSLERVNELVSSVRSAGIDVTIRRNGSIREVPASVGLAAYRIIQEALTNTIRHTPGSHACVTLDYGATELAITVSNDGPMSGPIPAGDGKGLAGMRRRVTALGGTVIAGPEPGGGFRLIATVPLPAA
jgi:signal transduction histidine kinase